MVGNWRRLPTDRPHEHIARCLLALHVIVGQAPARRRLARGGLGSQGPGSLDAGAWGLHPGWQLSWHRLSHAGASIHFSNDHNRSIPIATHLIVPANPAVRRRGAPWTPRLLALPWLESDPAAVGALFLDLPMPLVLESSQSHPSHGRWSFLTADPFLVVRSGPQGVEVDRSGVTERREAGPFETIESLLSAFACEPAPGGPPFQGGLAGYLGYELNAWLENVRAPAVDDVSLPDLCLGFYDWVLAWDHVEGTACLVSTGLPANQGLARARRAAARMRFVVDRLRAGASDGRRAHRRVPAPVRDDAARPEHANGSDPAAVRVGADAIANAGLPPVGGHPVPGHPGVTSTFSRDAYLAAVRRVREYILEGDIYQANLAQRLEAPLEAAPYSLYLALRERNPSFFGAYFDTGEAVVVSGSPERFIRHDRGCVETRPIKGTAPRGATADDDVSRAHRLRTSRKDRAENIMIVDLLRNDLSVVCEDDSVEVPELCALEHHPTVHHLVSTVTGRLRAGLGPVDLLRAAFPGGSITGAPKIRAMEIIAELEPVRRGVYTGAIGYIGVDGTMDTSIAIRTIVIHEGRALFGVGGGVVVDSDPEGEYQESLQKARALIDALASVLPAESIGVIGAGPAGGRPKERGTGAA